MMSDNLDIELWNEYCNSLIFRDKDKIKNLLERGANPNWFPPDYVLRRTLFMTVISSDSYEYTKMMLNYGADVKLKDIDGNTALHIALSKKVRNYEIIELLLRNGADINSVNSKGNTPLMQYIIRWDLVPEHVPKRVQLLIDYGADVNIKDIGGKRAIDYARKEEIKEILLNAELPGPKRALK